MYVFISLDLDRILCDACIIIYKHIVSCYYWPVMMCTDVPAFCVDTIFIVLASVNWSYSVEIMNDFAIS